MSAKGNTYVAAVLRADGTIDYRSRDEDMAESLSHPDARLGVVVFYGDYSERRRVESADPCPHCGYKGQRESHASWGFRDARPPVFVSEDGAFVLAEDPPVETRYDAWGSPIPHRRDWKITDVRETSALIDERRVRWIMNDWLERNV
jgi:hypothetical protein